MRAPFQMFSPELLAQMAQGAFQPPQGMNGGSPGGMQMPQHPGGGGLGAGLGAGAGMLGMGLANWKPGGGISEQGAVGPGGLSGAIAGIEALKPGANGQFAPPPMPTNIGYGQGGGGLGMPDFFSGAWRGITGFGGGNS